MTSFVTEPLAQNVKVVIFSQTDALVDPLLPLLHSYQLQVKTVSSQLSSLQTFEENDDGNWYKMIWIDDATRVSMDQARVIAKLFQKCKGISYLVLHQPFSVSADKKLNSIGRTLTEVVSFFEQRSPYTTLVTYRDVLTDEYFSLNYQFILKFLDKISFPLEQGKYRFVSRKELAEATMQLLSNPRGGRRRSIVSRTSVSDRQLYHLLEKFMMRRYPQLEFKWESPVKPEFLFDIPFVEVDSMVTAEKVGESLQDTLEEKWENKSPFQSNSNLPKPVQPPVKPKPQLKVVVQPRVEEKREEPKPEAKAEVVAPVAQPAHASEPAPVSQVKVLKEAPSKPAPRQESHLVLSNLENDLAVIPDIAERSIEVKVAPPKPAIPGLRPLMIPQAQPPTIHRSALILNQMKAAHKKVQTPSELPRQKIEDMSPQIVSRIKNQEASHQVDKNTKHKEYIEKSLSSLFAKQIEKEVKVTSKKIKHSPSWILFQGKKVSKKGRGVAKWKLFLGTLVASSATLVLVFFFTNWALKTSLLEAEAEFAGQGSIEQGTANSLHRNRLLVESQANLYEKIGGTFILGSLVDQIEAAKQLDELSMTFQKVEQQQVDLVQQLLTGKAITQPISNQTEIEEVSKQLSLLEGELKQSDVAGFWSTQLDQKKQETLLSSISEMRKAILVGQQLSEALPTFLFNSSEQTVAVLLQDSQELRATGGFIQSVAVLSFKKGALADVQFVTPDDVSAAITAKVVPPADLTKALNEQNWYFRDANWNADFPTTAKQVQSFLNKGLGLNVNAVIGMSTPAFAQLVDVVEGVSIPELGSARIDSTNFDQQEQEYMKKTLLDTSLTTDFLTSAHQTFWQKVKTINNAQSQQLIKTVSKQFKESEIVLWSGEPKIEQIVTNLGWNGELMSPPCPGQLFQTNCIVDHIYQVDSNVGVNKVNYFVKKSVEQNIQLSLDQVHHQRKVSYQNTSLSASFPGGSYRNYVRWYLPAKAENVVVLIGDKKVEPVIQSVSQQFQEVGALVEVAPGQTMNVVLEYTEPAFTLPGSYAFFDQKQPGTGDTPTQVTMFYAKEMTPLLIAPDAQLESDKIKFTLPENKNRFAGVKFR